MSDEQQNAPSGAPTMISLADAMKLVEKSVSQSLETFRAAMAPAPQPAPQPEPTPAPEATAAAERPPVAAAPHSPSRVRTAPNSSGLVDIFSLQPQDIDMMGPQEMRKHYERILDHAAQVRGAPPQPNPNRKR